MRHSRTCPGTYATWIQGPWKHTTPAFSKESFYDKNDKKDGFVRVPDTFFNLHARRDCTLVFSLVGLKDFYRLPAWGVDIKRSYELMTTISEDVHAHITNKDNKVIMVRITDFLVNAAFTSKTRTRI